MKPVIYYWGLLMRLRVLVWAVGQLVGSLSGQKTFVCLQCPWPVVSLSSDLASQSLRQLCFMSMSWQLVCLAACEKTDGMVGLLQ